MTNDGGLLVTMTAQPQFRPPPRWWPLALAGFALAVVAFWHWVFSVVPWFYDIDGPPVHVKVDAVSFCVPRRFVHPSDLGHQARSPGPITEWYHGPAVFLSLYSRALIGYTDDQYAAALKDVFAKAFYSADHVSLEILPERRLRPTDDMKKELFDLYEKSWRIESGFRLHMRRQDCVGKSVQWGALSAVTLGPECRDWAVMHGHPDAPDVVLTCSPLRCSTWSRLEKDGVQLALSFPRGYAADFPVLHRKVQERIANWRGDTSCHQGLK